ncbi:hypothetical protein 9F2_25 [uncultured Caudovirales phage]|uniref:Uncharacterized protein n=1 Tax=uncultured Caudovirales phage TaxID=2100421 RepID=A0A2H4JG45_9CAUD|nr:hypothetical protein 9F2_25 [uncultured Caudovirales phage]
MIFDPLTPSLPSLKAQFENEHERLNFPNLWHSVCLQIATELFDRKVISQEQCVERCELADAGLEHALEIHATWPMGWDLQLSYTLTCHDTGQVWARCSGCGFVRPDLGIHPVGSFTRQREGRIYLVDMFQQKPFGVFVTPTAAEIKGQLYEMVLAGRWDGQQVVPITDTPGQLPATR